MKPGRPLLVCFGDNKRWILGLVSEAGVMRIIGIGFWGLRFRVHRVSF